LQKNANGHLKSVQSPNEDVDEMKYQNARRLAAARKVAGETKESGTSESPGILRKIAGTVSEHPYLAAGTVAGLAGLTALQKRKRAEQSARYLILNIINNL